MNINNGNHKILFSKGKLYLDGVQIAGEGIIPAKDILFEFKINKPEESKEEVVISKDPSILEINVHDSIKGVDKGPGQRG